MSTGDASGGTGGGGAPGPGGGGPGGGSGIISSTSVGSVTSTSGEPLKIIKTQLIPHQPLRQHSPLPPTSPSPITTQIQIPTSAIHTTTLSKHPYSSTSLSSTAHLHAPPAHHHNAPTPTIHLKPNMATANSFSLNPVAAKITHVKTTTIDGSGVGGVPITIGTGIGNTIMTSNVSTVPGAIKMTTAGAIATSIGGAGGASIALNTSQSSTSVRAIGGQSAQVRVVMPMNSSMIKQLEGAAGLTQIRSIQPASARAVSNASITVTRPATQTTYLPRAGVTATQMTGVPASGVGMTTTSGQRLVTPIRATPTAGTTVTGLTAAGSFVRSATVSRNSNSPATTVISPATSTTWMATNTTGQVQLIRTIPHQSRQRIITTQGITNAGAAGSGGGGIAVSGTVVATTPTVVQTGSGQTQVQPVQGQSTIQAVGAQTVIPHSQQQHQQPQQTYVATLATVLPPRQHQATLVYSSNVGAATSQPLSQQQQFNPSVGTGQRFAVATPLTAATGTGAAPRQIRPIPLGKSFSTTKLNTTSISIRAPNIPQLTPTHAGGVAVSAGAVGINSPRSTTGATGNVIPTTNLPTTRIIQLQQQPGGGTQQIIGPTGRLTGNVMLQPIIVNTSATGKLGLRQPVTMAAKVQPSLTITQLGKLPSATGASSSLVQQQNVTASIQSIGAGGSNTSSASIVTPTSNVTATNLSGAQLVNVSQGTAGGQLLTTQNIVSSAGGATVVPLAITTRGGAGGNILTGTITPIKNGITVGKVMAAQAQLSSGGEGQLGVGGNASTSVYIHQTNAGQRQTTHGPTVTVTSSSISTPGSNSGVLTSTGATSVSGGNASTFLPPGSTIYYESVPASSVQVSTGVLSLTTTTVTSSTMSQNQIVSAAPNLAISSLPFSTHAANSTATFTVVPSSGGRTIGQLQIPVSSSGTGAQIQAVPVRFSAQLAAAVGSSASSNSSVVDTITVSQAAPQLMQSAVSSTGQQILIPATASHHGGGASGVQGQPQHMVIPLQGTAFLRKRDADGSPIRAAKNLGPMLLSMSGSGSGSSGAIASAAGSPAASSVSSTYSVASVSSSNVSSALTAEALAKKDRAAAAAAGIVSSTRSSRAESPASSDGSTTVSANSSPGVEQQIQDNNMVINRMSGANDATHFNPINDLYPNHHTVSMQHNVLATPTTSRHPHLEQQQQQMHNVNATAQRLNGATIDCLPRKRSRRSTNDSQLSQQSQASLSLPPPAVGNNNTAALGNNLNISASSNDAAAMSVGAAVVGNGMSAASGVVVAGHDGNNATNANNINHKTNNMPPIAGNKENAKPIEFVLRRPRNCTLLNSYKQTWKAANNHFQRYSDVKPREERRPTVIDLANQANVLGKINGWKIHHLRSQMEDLCENESAGYEKLSAMLKQMEGHGNDTEIERISELLKGNMQRSKIIVDGVNEAQKQIMKIFEHKSHISDIIHRCASKRNFKKREKL